MATGGDNGGQAIVWRGAAVSSEKGASHTHTHPCTHAYTHPCTPPCTHTPMHPHPHTHARARALSLSHPHTHTPIHALTPSHTLMCALILTLSHTHPCTHLLRGITVACRPIPGERTPPWNDPRTLPQSPPQLTAPREPQRPRLSSRAAGRRSAGGEWGTRSAELDTCTTRKLDSGGPRTVHAVCISFNGFSSTSNCRERSAIILRRQRTKAV